MKNQLAGLMKQAQQMQEHMKKVQEQLADRCELAAFDGHRMELRIAPGRETYLERSYQEKLKAALRRHLGEELHVTITVGEASGNSPADLVARKREQEQARAVKAIQEDEFVRELVENFGGRVNAIKPIQQ